MAATAAALLHKLRSAEHASVLEIQSMTLHHLVSLRQLLNDAAASVQLTPIERQALQAPNQEEADNGLGLLDLVSSKLDMVPPGEIDQTSSPSPLISKAKDKRGRSKPVSPESKKTSRLGPSPVKIPYPQSDLSGPATNRGMDPGGPQDCTALPKSGRERVTRINSGSSIQATSKRVTRAKPSKKEILPLVGQQAGGPKGLTVDQAVGLSAVSLDQAVECPQFNTEAYLHNVHDDAIPEHHQPLKPALHSPLIQDQCPDLPLNPQSLESDILEKGPIICETVKPVQARGRQRQPRAAAQTCAKLLQPVKKKTKASKKEQTATNPADMVLEKDSMIKCAPSPVITLVESSDMNHDSIVTEEENHCRDSKESSVMQTVPADAGGLDDRSAPIALVDAGDPDEGGAPETTRKGITTAARISRCMGDPEEVDETAPSQIPLVPAINPVAPACAGVNDSKSIFTMSPSKVSRANDETLSQQGPVAAPPIIDLEPPNVKGCTKFGVKQSSSALRVKKNGMKADFDKGLEGKLAGTKGDPKGSSAAPTPRPRARRVAAPANSLPCEAVEELGVVPHKAIAQTPEVLQTSEDEVKRQDATPPFPLLGQQPSTERLSSPLSYDDPAVQQVTTVTEMKPSVDFISSSPSCADMLPQEEHFAQLYSSNSPLPATPGADDDPELAAALPKAPSVSENYQDALETNLASPKKSVAGSDSHFLAVHTGAPASGTLVPETRERSILANLQPLPETVNRNSPERESALASPSSNLAATCPISSSVAGPVLSLGVSLANYQKKDSVMSDAATAPRLPSPASCSNQTRPDTSGVSGPDISGVSGPDFAFHFPIAASVNDASVEESGTPDVHRAATTVITTAAPACLAFGSPAALNLDATSPHCTSAAGVTTLTTAVQPVVSGSEDIIEDVEPARGIMEPGAPSNGLMLADGCGSETNDGIDVFVSAAESEKFKFKEMVPSSTLTKPKQGTGPGGNVVSAVRSFLPTIAKPVEEIAAGKKPVKVKALEAALTAKRAEEAKAAERIKAKEEMQQQALSAAQPVSKQASQTIKVGVAEIPPQGLFSPASKVNAFSAGVVKLKAAAFQQRIQHQDSNPGKKQDCEILPSQAQTAAPVSTATSLGLSGPKPSGLANVRMQPFSHQSATDKAKLPPSSLHQAVAPQSKADVGGPDKHKRAELRRKEEEERRKAELEAKQKLKDERSKTAKLQQQPSTLLKTGTTAENGLLLSSHMGSTALPPGPSGCSKNVTSSLSATLTLKILNGQVMGGPAGAPALNANMKGVAGLNHHGNLKVQEGQTNSTQGQENSSFVEFVPQGGLEAVSGPGLAHGQGPHHALTPLRSNMATPHFQTKHTTAVAEVPPMTPAEIAVETRNLQLLVTSPYISGLHRTPHGRAGVTNQVLSYEISPYRSDSDDEYEDNLPRKPVPAWAQAGPLQIALQRQHKIDPDQIFDTYGNLSFTKMKTCPLDAIFEGMPPLPIPADPSKARKRRDWRKRGSSGNWINDRLTGQEEFKYKKTMGFC